MAEENLPPPFGFLESRMARSLALVVGRHLIAQEIAQVEVLDFWVGAVEFGFARNYNFRVVILYFQQIAELPRYRLWVREP